LKAITKELKDGILVLCPYCGAPYKKFKRSEPSLRVHKKVFCKVCKGEFLIDLYL